MAKRPDLTDITAGYGSNTQHNANNDAIKTAFDNTLSRDGSTPNSMEADLDLNNNDLLNGGILNADDIVIDGTSLMDQVDAAAASATAAATSESNAAASATSAANSFDSFDDIYLGEKSSDPTTDNDGDALQTGALYWNSTDDELKVWNGSAWETVSGVSTFLDLTDTPSSYTGDGGKFVKIKAGEDGLEFAATTGSEPSDGDKGDITVSSSGTVWSIDNDVIGTAHLADEDWGDITISGGVATIDNDVVTRAKIADAAMSGADATLITGTAGTNGNLAEWNADGDLVDGPDVLDEDDMASDSATAVATQQSIKAYVDDNIPSGSETLVHKTADQSLATTTLTDDNHLAFTMAANTTYAFELYLIIQGDSGSDDNKMKIGWTVPTGATMAWDSLRRYTNNSDNIVDPRDENGTVTLGWTEFQENKPLHSIHKGVVFNGANAGDLQLQWAQVLSGAQSVNVLKHSHLIVRELGTT